MNAISQLYGVRNQWDSIVSKFLNGSNQIAKLSLSQIDYSNSDNQKSDQGYYGALIGAVSSGIEKKSLTVEMVLFWRNLILEEMLKFGVVTKEEIEVDLKKEEIKSFIEKILDAIATVESERNEINVVSLLGDIGYEMELKQLFYPIPRRMAHLLMSYVASYLKRPLIVFTSEDREDYLSSIHDRIKMRIYLSEKIRQAVFYNGLLLYRVGGKYASEWYKAEGSSKERDLIIEWHELFEAVRKWKEELAKK